MVAIEPLRYEHNSLPKDSMEQAVGPPGDLVVYGWTKDMVYG